MGRRTEHISRLMGLRLTVALQLFAAVAAANETPSPVTAYLAAVAQTLPGPAAEALPRIIGDEGRRLLAARGYLRAGSGLATRWSWSEAQIAGYQTSEQYRAALSEVEKVRARFAERNPGFELYVNTQVRSLDVQLARWNDNGSVAAAGQALLRDAERQLGAGYALPPDAAAVQRFARWLRGWIPPIPVTLAAPGLSAHGQGYAFDFQVQQGDRIVAGTDSTAIAGDWDAAGWAAKLAAAVAAASPHFSGPLAAPYEPWHYVYAP